MRLQNTKYNCGQMHSFILFENTRFEKIRTPPWLPLNHGFISDHSNDCCTTVNRNVYIIQGTTPPSSTYGEFPSAVNSVQQSGCHDLPRPPETLLNISSVPFGSRTNTKALSGTCEALIIFWATV